MIVVDASVAAKWYLPEHGTENALELMLGPDKLFGPEVIRFEVLGAITRRVRNGKATSAEARAQCDLWLKNLSDGAIRLVPEAELLGATVELSISLKHPLLDCFYLAAAKQLEAPLLTADRPFHDRVKPFYKKVSLLSGCETN